MLETVVSTCSLKDRQTWEVAAPLITANIKSKNYLVITPKDERKEFLKCTPCEYTVIADEEYISDAFSRMLRAKIAETNKGAGRYGWYLQQFIKLSALEQTSPRETTLIWDADTIPLKKLSFETNGKTLFYKGNEYHAPYFRVIRDLLGLEKTNDFSFIAQCIPCKGYWSRDFFKLIEERTGQGWKEGILGHINLEEGSGFSEYESLGTFVQSKYPEEMFISSNRWCRRGNGLIGSVHNLRHFKKVLRRRYDFMSFEGWDEPYSALMGKRTRKLLEKIRKILR